MQPLSAIFFIFITPKATIITPMAIKLPPSPAILAAFSDSIELDIETDPPMIN